MSVRYSDNTAYIKAKVSSGVPLALRFALDDIQRISNPKTPRRLGDLRLQVRKEVRGRTGTITWWSNHAIYQEDPKKPFTNYTTPGTGPHFAKNSVHEVVHNFDYYLKKAGIK